MTIVKVLSVIFFKKLIADRLEGVPPLVVTPRTHTSPWMAMLPYQLDTSLTAPERRAASQNRLPD